VKLEPVAYSARMWGSDGAVGVEILTFEDSDDAGDGDEHSSLLRLDHEIHEIGERRRVRVTMRDPSSQHRLPLSWRGL
jgi:hypothetical protein